MMHGMWCLRFSPGSRDRNKLFLQTAYSRRDLLDVFLLFGAVFNVGFGKVLKACFRQSRPELT